MKFIKRYTPGLLLFTLFTAISLFTYKDYGISWDEPLTREMGGVYYDYVFAGKKNLETYQERDHGSGFELFLTAFEQPFHYADTRGIFHMRHLVTHLFFLFSAFCGYLLFYKLFNKQLIACIGFLLLVLQPRIYAHSFFNSKDLSFLSAVMIALALGYMVLRTNKIKWHVWFGLACGYMCSIRVPGILLPSIFLGIFGFDIANALVKKEK